MITAHLVVPAAVLGGVFPDFDMFWFYFIDNRAIHHHRYWVHVPGFWLLLGAVLVPLIAWLGRQWLPAALAFLAAVFVHIGLDSIAGGIMWLWPFSTQLHSLFEIPARYDQWVLNFIPHPVFILELIIWAAALTLWLRRV